MLASLKATIDLIMIKVAWGLEQLALNPWRSSTGMFDEPAEMSVPPAGLMHTVLRQRKRRFPRVQFERRVRIGKGKLVADGTGREIGNTGQKFELVECGEAVSWFHGFIRNRNTLTLTKEFGSLSISCLAMPFRRKPYYAV